MATRDWAVDARDAVFAAEEAERRYAERVRLIRARTDPSLQYGVDVEVGQDPDAQGAIADNRWHIARATMYAELAVAQRLGIIVNELRELRREVRGDSGGGAGAGAAGGVDANRSVS